VKPRISEGKPVQRKTNLRSRILSQPGKFWEMFWASFNSSNIISGLMAFCMTGLIIYLSVRQIVIPELVSFSFGAIIAYFFADKQTKATARREDEIAARDARIKG